jgi:hypothetical protein
MIVSTSVSNPVQAPDVCLPEVSGVTTKECAECNSIFEPENKIQRFCSGACRQRAYRRSPAHRAQLNGKKQQRRNRRLYQHQEKYRACSIGFDSRFGGPINESVPSVGNLDLKRFSKIKE